MTFITFYDVVGVGDLEIPDTFQNGLMTYFIKTKYIITKRRGCEVGQIEF